MIELSLFNKSLLISPGGSANIMMVQTAEDGKNLSNLNLENMVAV